jgi:uncharacterized protein YggT (Ycf19 family)
MSTTILGPQLGRHDVVVRVASVVDFVFGLVYAFLGIRLLLVLIDARPNTGFVRFINALTDKLYAPFRGILPTETLDGTHSIAWSLVVAIVAYLLLHALVRALLRLVDRA